MITINKIIQVVGEAPFSYVWSADDDCVTFSKASGTSTTGIIDTNIVFFDEACLEDAAVTLTVTSACGNSLAIDVTVDNVCDNLVNASLSSPVFLSFSAIAGNNTCSGLTFKWIVDTSVLTIDNIFTSAFSSNITCSLASANPPATTPVTVIITDCNGCVETLSSSFGFCIPTLPQIQVTAHSPNTTTDYTSGVVTLGNPAGCSDFTADWSTLALELPVGFTFVNLGSGTVKITAPYGKTVGTYSGTYTMKSTSGINAVKGNLVIQLVRQAAGKEISATNKIVTLDCSVDPGDYVTINIEDEIVLASGAVVDWNTFQLVSPPTPISTSVTLTTNSSGKHVIQYLVPSPITADSFAWTVCTTTGSCMDAVVYTVVDCIQAPIAANDAVSVVCQTSTVLDILTNDNGNGSPIDVSSVVITQAPTVGTVLVNSNGTVTYTTALPYTGTDTFKYKVKNISGALSNEATVTVTVICAGEDVNVALCN